MFWLIVFFVVSKGGLGEVGFSSLEVGRMFRSFRFLVQDQLIGVIILVILGIRVGLLEIQLVGELMFRMDRVGRRRVEEIELISMLVFVQL